MRYQKPDAPEFRRQMIELVAAGRTPGELSREFGCAAQTISNWVAEQQSAGSASVVARSKCDYARFSATGSGQNWGQIRRRKADREWEEDCCF